MNRIRSRALRVAAGLALAAVGAASGLTAQAATASVPVDLRVVSNEAGNLVDIRQYVPLTRLGQDLRGRRLLRHDGPDQAVERHHVPAGVADDARGARRGIPVQDGAPAVQGVRRRLLELRCSERLPGRRQDAAGVLLPEGQPPGPPGGSRPLHGQPGEDLLAYRTPDDFTADEELELTAPTRTAPGVPITVNVRAYTDTLGPREGATVLGGDAPALTNAGGNASVSFAAPGRYTLFAGGSYNDIPSAPLSVCVAPDPLTACPAERGREILGSDEPEGIRGTDGEDLIRPRAGDDVVKAREGNDRIISQGGGKDVVNCGSGKDQVTRDGRDRVAKNCEKVLGKKLKRKKGKKKARRARGTPEGREEAVIRSRRLAATAAMLAAVAVGCGVGEGEESGDADLLVTRDYGASELQGEQVEISESETVLRMLDSSAEIETRFNGGFVQSIDGLSGGTEDGRRSDWFFFVNGVESPVGAAEYEVEDGDRVWWDHRDWSTAMRVPAVVGSWPEPFLHGSDPGDPEGESWGAGVFCGGAREPVRAGQPDAERGGHLHRRRARRRGRFRCPRTRSASWSAPGTRSTPTPWRGCWPAARSGVASSRTSRGSRPRSD